ncbi:hypothetical protein Daura_13180 [Dactylosporangium aurantiacum]|uniref:Uncharacterized protein n=1 Tax=Dactylosporangium aurantiacum TaxID=35754 RepID=A0A9Q9IPP6_9ACTN|nr:hypothetical protein [Dactylosporangium aurantiacum]MDG6105637.1 hypothetical protein [Dactylosporangium aurantiacum]UWZ57030.1 hypothetical protein Daura_13180 [Dactylosporangium aurantiacum]
MADDSPHVPHAGHYALLALLPPAAGIFLWQAAGAAAHAQLGWATISAGLLAGVAATVVWARRVRTSVTATAAAAAIVADIAVNVFGDLVNGATPAHVVGFGGGYVAGQLLVSEVVLALWMHGNYRFEPGHRVSVWLLSGRTGDEPDYYQARCECAWTSERFPVADGDESEELAFEVARGHSPTVRADLAVQL